MPRALALAQEGRGQVRHHEHLVLPQPPLVPALAATAGMPLWQDKLFIAMTKAASDASGFYRLPSNRVLELGQQLVV